jgi:hypothetical protein
MWILKRKKILSLTGVWCHDIQKNDRQQNDGPQINIRLNDIHQNRIEQIGKRQNNYHQNDTTEQHSKR